VLNAINSPSYGTHLHKICTNLGTNLQVMERGIAQDLFKVRRDGTENILVVYMYIIMVE
jgi:hypothetical protein